MHPVSAMSDQLAILGGQPAISDPQALAQACTRPGFDEDEVAAVCQLLREGASYSEIRAFEQEFAQWLPAQFALAQNNGTSTLHAAYFACGVGPGDEVIVSAYTWHLAVGPILALHALPVFCDIDPLDGTIDPEQIERNITPRTKAINVVHPFGAVADMAAIMDVANRHGIPVIEDCSHAHGAEFSGRRVGSIGQIGCFSLQKSKLLTAIEGGVLTTDDRSLYERAVALGHYELIKNLEDPHLRRLAGGPETAPANFGFKYRMHPLAAALARAQLKKLQARNQVRDQNMRYIAQAIGEIGGDVLRPPAERPGTKRVWFEFICQFDEDKAGVSRDRFVEALQAEGLKAKAGRSGYLPVYWNPIYSERMDIWGRGAPFDGPASPRRIEYPRGLCPRAEEYCRRQVSLPIVHRRADRELLDQYIAAIAKVLSNLDKL